MKIKNVLSVFLLTLLVITCSSEPETYTVEVIDGVRHVHNLATKWGDEPEVELEFVRKIGGLDETDENYMLYMAINAAKDTEGNYYIMDRGNSRVQKYDGDGKFVLTIGTKGEGPGEFVTPIGIDIAGDNTLYVSDMSNRRFEHFDLDGNHINSINMSGGAFVLLSYFRCLGEDRLAALVNRITMPGDEEKEDKKMYSIYDSDGNLVNEIVGQIKADDDQYTDTINNTYFAVDDLENLFITYRNQNLIAKYSSEGIPLMRIDRPLNFEIEYKMVDRNFPGGRTRSIPYVTEVANKIGIDEKDRIWVMTFTNKYVYDENWETVKSADRAFHVFDSEGIYLGNVPRPSDDLFFIRLVGDSILFCDKDYVSVHEYRIVEK
ncbi:MAG: 6-bladed beta-propeller [bacterium]|nr:6-bladed beta-propeller [bacterium]